MKHIYCKPTIEVTDLDTEEIMVVPFSNGKLVRDGSIVPGTEGDVNITEVTTETESQYEDENMGAKSFSFDFE